MRKINWRWFRFIRERQPDIPLAHYRAEEALDSGDDIKIKPPPKSAFLTSLQDQDNTVLGIGACFIVAGLILFAIILFQQNMISNQRKVIAKIPKLKQSVKFQKGVSSDKTKVIVNQATRIRLLEAHFDLEKLYKQQAKEAEKELKEAQNGNN